VTSLTPEAREALRAEIPADVLAICRRLRDAGHQAHLVGGGVRDMLIGRPPTDFDVATDARPEAVVALFGTTFAIPTGLKHGTVTVLSGPDRRHVGRWRRRRARIWTTRPIVDVQR